MGNDKAYIYGCNNGAEYDEIVHYADDNGNAGREIKKRTHWDPRIEVSAFPEGGLVQIGVVPPTPYEEGSGRGIELDPISSANEPPAGEKVMEWFGDNGQFLSVNRSGLNRLIEALQEAGAATFGRDRW